MKLTAQHLLTNNASTVLCNILQRKAYMIQDLHSHTYYSFCGKDAPEEVIEAAIKGGIKLLGITDHSYGIGMSRPCTLDNPERLADFQRALNAYSDHINLLKEKYASEITIKCGIEIATENQPYLIMPKGIDLSRFDFCLIESIASPISVCEDLFEFADECGCPVTGIAHTDLPDFLDSKGIDKFEYFSKMAQRGIFWEMNVNYDSIHKYREHKYVKDFFEDTELQDTVRRSGLRLSVGFDGHKVEDYLPERIQTACQRITELKIPLVFE